MVGVACVCVNEKEEQGCGKFLVVGRSFFPLRTIAHRAGCERQLDGCQRSPSTRVGRWAYLCQNQVSNPVVMSPSTWDLLFGAKLSEPCGQLEAAGIRKRQKPVEWLEGRMQR